MEYATYESRETSFAPPSKRSKTGGWPHAHPTPAELAKAGFYYKPSAHSNDNTVCFLCSRNLDGWEEEDDPIHEHYKHAQDCGWATLASIGTKNHYDTAKIEDPTGQNITEARRATFAVGWPHDSKRGWTCKTEKMVEAGWHFAPTRESEDYVSCVYCKLSLDGWEPKDNPFEEHYSRSPQCPFFVFAGTTAPSKRPKAKKGRASRSSRSSKASARLSSQSNVSIQSDVASIPDLEESIDGSANTSIVSVMSTASTATTKGKRSGTGRAKSTKPKKIKTTKKAEVEPEIEALADEDVLVDVPIPGDLEEQQEISYPHVEAEDPQIASEVIPTLEQEEMDDTPRPISPIQSPGPPEREGSAIRVMAESPVPLRAPISEKTRLSPRSPLRRETKIATPEPHDSPSRQSDLENAPPSTRPESVRPPLSSPGTVPPKWSPVDTEMIFQTLSGVATLDLGKDGDLTGVEQQMTVQDWIKHIATRAEDDLRAEGERVVSILEEEGQRALRVLEGIVCV